MLITSRAESLEVGKQADRPSSRRLLPSLGEGPADNPVGIGLLSCMPLGPHPGLCTPRPSESTEEGGNGPTSTMWCRGSMFHARQWGGVHCRGGTAYWPGQQRRELFSNSAHICCRHSSATTRHRAVGRWSAFCCPVRLPHTKFPSAVRPFPRHFPSFPHFLHCSSVHLPLSSLTHVRVPDTQENQTPGTTDPDARCAVLACSGAAVGSCVFLSLRNIRPPNFFLPLSLTRTPTHAAAVVHSHTPSPGRLPPNPLPPGSQLQPHNPSTFRHLHRTPRAIGLFLSNPSLAIPYWPPHEWTSCSLQLQLPSYRERPTSLYLPQPDQDSWFLQLYHREPADPSSSPHHSTTLTKLATQDSIAS